MTQPDDGRRLERLELLLDLYRAGSVADSEAELMALAARRIAEVLRDSASILVLDPGGEWLRLAAAHALDPAAAALIRRLGRQPMRASDGVAGLVLQTGRPVYLSGGVDEHSVPNWNEAYSPFLHEVGIHSLLAAPLRHGGRVFGVVEVARTGANHDPFTEADAALLDAVVGDGSVFETVRIRADLAAAAERERRRAERERIHAEVLEAAARAGDGEEELVAAVVEALAPLGGVAVVHEVSPDGTRSWPRARAAADARVAARLPALDPDAPAPAHEGAMGEILRTGSPVFEPALDPGAPPAFVREAHRPVLAGIGMRGLAAVPLRLGGGIRGAVGILHVDPEFRGYERADLELLETIAGTVSTLLETAAHRTASRRAAEALRLLAGERDRLAREAQETAATLAAILDAAPLAILAVDLENRVTFWSAGAERQYGWSRDAVIGRPLPHVPEEAAEGLRAQWAALLGGEPRIRVEAQRRHRDGRVFDMVVHAVPLRDPDGTINGFMSVAEDVTERRRLEAELVQAQKMETIGQLAGGVAHDFNNILTAVMGYAELARQGTAEPETATMLDTIHLAAQRAAGLTQQLLAFSRRQMLVPETLDANEVLHGVEAILRRLIGEHIELVVSTRADAGSIVVDRTQLEQVILNLAVNARDAMPDGGRLVVGTDVAVIEEAHPHLSLETGAYVVLSVTDTGLGMDAETREHIFEPFYTTKDVGRGTGLGLSTVYGVVRQSGGHIWVYSEPGTGTTFRIYFPRAQGSPATPGEPEPVARERASGRCLLVEDEPLLRELGASILTREGLAVRTAGSGVEALEVADAMDDLDVLVADVIMPGGSGVELARRLRVRRPELPVVLMSGYAPEATEGIAEADAFLHKPFTSSALVEAVLGVLTPAATTDSAEGRSDPTSN